jgi:hypothetical protein
LELCGWEQATSAINKTAWRHFNGRPFLSGTYAVNCTV